jgi:hypothetical protein
LDEKGRQNTPKQRRIFETQYPTSQRFTKTDLAKYENTWDQKPFLVSLGAEKNFREFVQNLKEKETFEPSDEYFKLLVAKAILLKKADKIILNQKYGGYKANIVTYTVALLSYLSQKRVDLEKIWKDQDISRNIENELILLSRIVQTHITNPPGGKNITEWCKKKECWEFLLQKQIQLSELIVREFVDPKIVVQREEQIMEHHEEKQKETEPIEEITEKVVIKEDLSDIDYERIIQNYKPRNWYMLIRDVKNAGIFSQQQVLILQRMEKITARNIKPKPDEIQSVVEILKQLTKQSEKASSE